MTYSEPFFNIEVKVCDCAVALHYPVSIFFVDRENIDSERYEAALMEAKSTIERWLDNLATRNTKNSAGLVEQEQ